MNAVPNEPVKGLRRRKLWTLVAECEPGSDWRSKESGHGEIGQWRINGEEAGQEIG
jgi:hypothetical protein